MNPLHPPTPTIQPTMQAVELDITALRVDTWDYADETIQLWNQFEINGFVTPFQIIILIAILVAFAILIIRLLERLAKDSTQ